MRLNTGNFVGRVTRFVNARPKVVLRRSADAVPAWVSVHAPDGATLIDLHEIEAIACDIAVDRPSGFDEHAWRARLRQLAWDVPRTNGVAMRFLEDFTAAIVKDLASMPAAHTQRALEVAEEDGHIYFLHDDESDLPHDEAEEAAWRLRLRELVRQVPGSGGTPAKRVGTVDDQPAVANERRDGAPVRVPGFDEDKWSVRLRELAGQVTGCGGSLELFLKRFSALVDDELGRMSEAHAQRAREIALDKSGYYDRSAQTDEEQDSTCAHGLDFWTCPCGCFE